MGTGRQREEGQPYFNQTFFFECSSWGKRLSTSQAETACYSQATFPLLERPLVQSHCPGLGFGSKTIAQGASCLRLTNVRAQLFHPPIRTPKAMCPAAVH